MGVLWILRSPIQIRILRWILWTWLRIRWILWTSLWLWILRMGQIDEFNLIRPFKRGIIILRTPNSKFYNNTTAQDLEINTCQHHFDFLFYICSKLPPEEKKISSLNWFLRFITCVQGHLK